MSFSTISTDYGTIRPAERFDVSLVRYTLSYSASSPLLIQYFARLFEKAILPSWMSHYALSIGNDKVKYYFDLYREGSLPFASVAYFRVVNAKDENQKEQAFRKNRPLEPLKLGTTELDPIDIVRTIEKQDKVYAEKSASASNCLIGVPREYSLLQSNCQHFILELIRRIDFECEGDAYAKVKEASTRPRFYSHLLLSTIGVFVNLAIALLPPEPMTFLVAAMYHFAYSMVMIQDYSIRKQRTERFYNEHRYSNLLGNQSARGNSHYKDRIEAQQSTPESEQFYLTSLILFTIWMAWPLSLIAYFGFLKLGFWIIGFIVIAIVAYCLGVCLPAFSLLVLLKSGNNITLLRKEEAKKRVEAAYQYLEDQWDACEGSSICPVCSPIAYEDTRSTLLSKIIRNNDASDNPCGNKDIEKAILGWCPQHRLPSEVLRSYKIKLTLKVYGVCGFLMGLTWLLYKHWPVGH